MTDGPKDSVYVCTRIKRNSEKNVKHKSSAGLRRIQYDHGSKIQYMFEPRLREI